MDWMVESFIDSCPGAKVGWFWNLLMRSFKLLCFVSPGNLYFINLKRFVFVCILHVLLLLYIRVWIYSFP